VLINWNKNEYIMKCNYTRNMNRFTCKYLTICLFARKRNKLIERVMDALRVGVGRTGR